LQAFPYRVSQYDGQYVGIQVETARLSGASGWCLWNPACRYSLALDVLAELCPVPALQPVSMNPQDVFPTQTLVAKQVEAAVNSSEESIMTKQTPGTEVSQDAVSTSSLVGTMVKNTEAGIQKP